jgi:predicted transcriptional regulator
MIRLKGVEMNIFDIKETKIKAYLKYLYDHGATTKNKGVGIEDVESALRMDDRMFDEITKYLLAEGYTQRSARREIYITRTGVSKIR